jgi:hypothetical protein
LKVGIITFHAASNYGAVLQAFALQVFLKQAGHSPFFIDYHYGITQKGLRKYIARTPRKTLSRWADVYRQYVFAQFRKQYLNLSDNSYLSADDLLENPPSADAYICGSDQVWNPSFLKNRKDELAFFLEFGAEEIRRIAYAASIGGSVIPDNWKNRFSQHLNRFNFVSVRENVAVTALSSLSHTDIVWVPDPTLLLNREDYENNLTLNVREKSNVFSYILGRIVPPSVIQIRDYVCELLAADYVETYKRDSLGILVEGVPDPCRWISLLRSSQFVVTNSFHGTIFSILFKRPFIVLPLNGPSASMNVRIISLLSRFGLEDRFITEFDSRLISELCTNEINWDLVDNKINAFREVGAEFLSKALLIN